MAAHERKSVSRRDFLRWAGIGTAGAALAACAPKEVIVTQQVEVTREVEVPVQETVEVEKEVQVEVTAAPEAKTINVLWGNWGDFFNDLMTNLGKSYTEQNPNVTVEWNFSPSYLEELMTAVASGTPPDATYSSMDHNINLAFQGAFLPLDAYLVMTGLERQDFVLPMYDASVWDGKLYTLPGGADFYALFWNKSAYEDAGLDPESPPKTTNELVEHSLKILQVDDTGAIQRLGWSPNTWGDPLWMWSGLFGGQWYDELSGKITADDPINIETLNWMKSYVDQIDINQLEAFNQSTPDFWSPGNSFASKKTALRFDGFWTYDPLDSYAPDIDYGIAFFPTPNGTKEELKDLGVRGWLVAIPSGVADPDTSWDFLKFGFVDNAWKMGCDTLNGNAVIAQMDQWEQCVVDGLGADNRMTPYFDVWTETGILASKHWPAIPVNAFYLDELDRAYDFVIRGEKTAEEALQEVTDTVQGELDRALQG